MQPFMVRGYGVPEEHVGDKVGLVASGFFLGQALTSYYPVRLVLSAMRLNSPAQIPVHSGACGRTSTAAAP